MEQMTAADAAVWESKKCMGFFSRPNEVVHQRWTRGMVYRV